MKRQETVRSTLFQGNKDTHVYFIHKSKSHRKKGTLLLKISTPFSSLTSTSPLIKGNPQPQVDIKKIIFSQKKTVFLSDDIRGLFMSFELEDD